MNDILDITEELFGELSIIMLSKMILVRAHIISKVWYNNLMGRRREVWGTITENIC